MKAAIKFKLREAIRFICGKWLGTADKNPVEISLVVSEELKKINISESYQDQLHGIASGFSDLDRATGGWQRGNLVIIGSRPAMGGTALGLALACNAAIDQKKPVVIFSPETSSSQLVQKLFSMETQLRSDQIRNGYLYENEYRLLVSKIDGLKNAPILIDDTPAINVFDLHSKCRKLKKQQGIEMVIIDCLQLITGISRNKNGESETDFGRISRCLKGMAKELEIPVIVLSQFSRALEKRGGDGTPILSDLRKAGTTEEDADVVILLYREEYYSLDFDYNGESTKDIAKLIIAKNSNGPVRTVKTRFINKFAKFENLDETGARE